MCLVEEQFFVYHFVQVAGGHGEVAERSRQIFARHTEQLQRCFGRPQDCRIFEHGGRYQAILSLETPIGDAAQCQASPCPPALLQHLRRLRRETEPHRKRARSSPPSIVNRSPH